MKNSLFIALMLSGIICSHAYGQGCSDAGFCTAGVMQGGQKVNDTSNQKSSWGISLTIGNGENRTTTITPQAEGKIQLSPKAYLEGKFPANYASGNLGSHTGIGDPIITCSNILLKQNGLTIITTAGVRIGISSASAKSNGLALPMPYQSSLGTTDLIAGIALAVKKYVSISAGYQQPLLQYNNNNYQPSNVYPTMRGNHDYFASKELKRKGDLLLRIDAHYQWKKILVSAGPLLICHLGEDTYTTATGNSAVLTGSSGITLNVASSLSYTRKDTRIDVLGGIPFIVRSYRPDGLTRSFVFTLRYTRFR